MRAEIISIGNELLRGEVSDANADFLSRRLRSIGLEVLHRSVAPDDPETLAGAFRQALRRSALVVASGGLGPTPSDVTREALARSTGRALARDQRAVARLNEFFARRNRVPAENNYRQCDLPAGGEFLKNDCGTAPGIFINHGGVMVFALPGPPGELREMFEKEVLPRLAERVRREGGSPPGSRVLRLCGIGESNLAAALSDLMAARDDPSIALYATPGEVRVHLSTRMPDGESARRALSALEKEVRRRFPEFIYGADDETMESVIGRLLRERKAKLAVAESCTGGLISHRITNVPGASDYFVAGLVTYANHAKVEFLGVSREVLRRHGAVSEECARAMAEGARKAAGADFGLAVTGIAGPGGGTAKKPAGLVFLALADGSGLVCERHFWPGPRERFKQLVSQLALNLLRKRLLGIE